MLSTTGGLSRKQTGPRANRGFNKYLSGAVSAGADILFLDGTAEAFLLINQPASNHFTLGQRGALLSSVLTSWSEPCKTEFRPVWQGNYIPCLLEECVKAMYSLTQAVGYSPTLSVLFFP